MTNPGLRTMTNKPADREDEQGSENVPIRHIQTVHIRYDEHTGKYRLTLTPAIRAAGLDANAMFRYLPEEVDELGLVPALGVEDGITSPRDGRTYSVVAEGKGDVFRLQIPETALEALGIEPDPETAKEGNLPMLDVFAGDRMIAFDRSNAIAISTKLLPDDFEGDTDADEVILEQAQTTTPNMRTYDVVTAKLTAAVRQAGRGEKNELGAIEYLPELSADLGGGIVPAVVSKYGDGRARGDAYSLSRVAANSGKSSNRGFEAAIPEDVLAALDLSGDDYADVPLEERPALTVYAGDHLLAFGRPGERDVAVDRGQTPGPVPPSLTDLDGIGSALADRLTNEGYDTVEDLADATREDLLAIDGLGERRARFIMADVADRMNKRGEDQ